MTEDHPDRHVVVEQGGGDRAVLGAELLEEPGGVALGLGSVEPAQPAGSERSDRVRAVGGAAGGGPAGVPGKE
ncbi:hypothetical protein [Streptomyces sp. S-2]|uniref:hypothetical protein n=1 Tax=Streptomyces sp. S-2 TaxID=2675217 RepID=UPI00210E3C6F